LHEAESYTVSQDRMAAAGEMLSAFRPRGGSKQADENAIRGKFFKLMHVQ
jgi:hypothetical protein